MPVELISTKTKVRDPQRVRTIFNSYDVRGAEFELLQEGQEWFLVMTFMDDDPDSFEQTGALHVTDWPLEENAEEQDEYAQNAWDRLYMKKGREGFKELLCDLAACLETPLVILAADWNWKGSSTKVWSIQPGARGVATLGVAFGD